MQAADLVTVGAETLDAEEEVIPETRADPVLLEGAAVHNSSDELIQAGKWR